MSHLTQERQRPVADQPLTEVRALVAANPTDDAVDDGDDREQRQYKGAQDRKGNQEDSDKDAAQKSYNAPKQANQHPTAGPEDQLKDQRL